MQRSTGHLGLPKSSARCGDGAAAAQSTGQKTAKNSAFSDVDPGANQQLYDQRKDLDTGLVFLGSNLAELRWGWLGCCLIYPRGPPRLMDLQAFHSQAVLRHGGSDGQT